MHHRQRRQLTRDVMIALLCIAGGLLVLGVGGVLG
jgi:hypothetical protein